MQTDNPTPEAAMVEVIAAALFSFDTPDCSWEEWLGYVEQHKTFRPMTEKFRERARAIAAAIAASPPPVTGGKGALREAAEQMLTAIAALGARSPGTPNTYFDEHPMSEEGIVRWWALDTAGKAVRAALATPATGGTRHCPLCENVAEPGQPGHAKTCPLRSADDMTPTNGDEELATGGTFADGVEAAAKAADRLNDGLTTTHTKIAAAIRALQPGAGREDGK